MKNITQHPAVLYTNDLKEICQPLKALGIEYFSHVIVDEAEQFSALATNPDFTQLYFQKEYYNFDIHRTIPHHEGYIFWDLMERDTKLEELYDDFKSFSLGHSFTVIHQDINGCKHYYDFSAALHNHSINNIYFRQLDFLKKFILYFTEKIHIHRELKQAYDIKFSMQKESQLNLNENIHLPLSYSRIYFTPNIYLTLREFECLHLLAQGKTIEEAAIILSITQRTMKAHVANIKQKLNCKSLFQLGAIYQKWKTTNSNGNYKSKVD